MTHTTDIETLDAVKEEISKLDGWSQKKVEVSARRIKAIIDESPLEGGLALALVGSELATMETASNE